MTRKHRVAEKDDPQLYHIHFKAETVPSIDINALSGQIAFEVALDTNDVIEIGKCDGEPTWGSEVSDGSSDPDNYGFTSGVLLAYTIEIVMHGFKNKKITDPDYINGHEGDDNWLQTVALKDQIGTFYWNCPSTGKTHRFENLKLGVTDSGKGNASESLPITASATAGSIDSVHKRAGLQIGEVGEIRTVSVINAGTGHIALDELATDGGNDTGAIIIVDTVDDDGAILTASISHDTGGTQYAVGNGLIQRITSEGGGGEGARFIVAALVEPPNPEN